MGLYSLGGHGLERDMLPSLTELERGEAVTSNVGVNCRRCRGIPSPPPISIAAGRGVPPPPDLLPCISSGWVATGTTGVNRTGWAKAVAAKERNGAGGAATTKAGAGRVPRCRGSISGSGR